MEYSNVRKPVALPISRNGCRAEEVPVKLARMLIENLPSCFDDTFFGRDRYDDEKKGPPAGTDGPKESRSLWDAGIGIKGLSWGGGKRAGPKFYLGAAISNCAKYLGIHRVMHITVSADTIL
jgi:hypothetical protein